MQWEHLNQQEFCEAVRDTQLCIVPMGVLERHGVGRCVWSYKEMDFGLADSRWDALRPGLLELL